MGIGPTYAVPRVLELTGLSINDVDLFEVSNMMSPGWSTLKTFRSTRHLPPCMFTVFVSSAWTPEK
jgi:Thiolase, C-terminal domain